LIRNIIMLKLKPSARIKKRYLLIEGKRENIEKVILDYIGILGWARASVVFVNSGEGKVIVSVDRKELANVRAAFEMCKEDIKVLRVSGTIDGLRIK